MDFNAGTCLLAIASASAVAAGLVARRPIAWIIRTSSTSVGGVVVHYRLTRKLHGCSRIVINTFPDGSYAIWGRPDAGSSQCLARGFGPANEALKAAGYRVRR